MRPILLIAMLSTCSVACAEGGSFPDDDLSLSPPWAAARAAAVLAHATADANGTAASELIDTCVSLSNSFFDLVGEYEDYETADTYVTGYNSLILQMKWELLDYENEMTKGVAKGQQGDDNPDGIGLLSRTTLYGHASSHCGAADTIAVDVKNRASGLSTLIAQRMLAYELTKENEEQE